MKTHVGISWGVVYLIRCGESYKIGRTNGPVESRVRQLQAGNPQKLELICVFPDPCEIERMFHRLFHEKRTNGEWFSLDDHDVEIIKVESGRARRRAAHNSDVYIGRENRTYGLPASKWGNPFRLERESDRPIVLARYRIWLLGEKELLAALPELRGKRLACWCSPLACHGDVLAELAETKYGEGVVAAPVLATPDLEAIRARLAATCPMIVLRFFSKISVPGCF